MGFVELQMTWQPSLLSEQRKKGPPLGLRNLGNSCYLNSVLQCLTYTPPLANFCLRSQHSSFCDASASKKPRECPFCILEAWISRSLTLDLTLDSPSKIQSCLKIFAEHFRFGRQEDAHEFLRYVIDACHNTCLRLKKLRRKGRDEEVGGGGEAVNGNTVVKEIFGGALQSQVKCLGCGGESNKVDEIMDISLDILNCGSLKEAMHKFFQPEVLDGNNKYKCDNCKKLVAARKQLSILRAPNILVIQLKRFEGILGGKIDRLIRFEEVLVLSSFICKASQDPQPEYSLFGAIVHSGYSPESGHYYAYIKDAMGRWYCCNDSFVSLSTLQEVLSEKVYILFFSRTKRPGSFRTTFSSNVVKPCDSNGSEAYKILKAVQLKPVQKKPGIEQSSQKDKVGKLYSSLCVKFNVSENPGTKKLPVTSNGKFDFHKNQNIAGNGVTKDLVCIEKNEKNVLSLMNRNGIDNSRKVEAVSSGKSQPFALANGSSKKSNPFVVNGSRSMAVRGEVDTAFVDASDNSEQKKISENSFDIYGPKRKLEGSSDMSGIKRKLEDSCDVPGSKRKSEDSFNFLRPKRQSEASSDILRPNRKSEDSCDNSIPMTIVKSGPNRKLEEFCDYSGPKKTDDSYDFFMPTEKSCVLLSQDAQSRAEVEIMKEMLKNEASSVLRSSGWYVDVYNFMNLRKQSCTLEIGSTLCGNDLEKKLIADAKPTFIPQIPESLKEKLIKRLHSFCQRKRESLGL